MQVGSRHGARTNLFQQIQALEHTRGSRDLIEAGTDHCSTLNCRGSRTRHAANPALFDVDDQLVHWIERSLEPNFQAVP